MLFLYAFIVAFAFALSDSLWKIPLRYATPAICIFFRNILTSLFLGIFAWQQGDWAKYEWWSVGQAVGISVISFWGIYFFVKSQQFIALSWISILRCMQDFIQFSIGIIVFQEKMTGQKAVIFGIVLCSIFLMNWKPNTNFRFNKGFLMLFLAALFWGISGAFTRPVVLQIGASGFGFILELTILFMSFLMNSRSLKTTWKIPFAKVLPPLFLIAVLGSTGVYFNNLGYGKLPVSVWVILGLCSSFVPIAISYFYYREKLQKQQWIGILLCVGVSLFFFAVNN